MPIALRYDLTPDVLLQRANGEALLVKLSAEDMFALNETGAGIVERLAAGRTVEEIVRELATMYDAPATDVARDVHRLVEELVARGLLLARGEA